MSIASYASVWNTLKGINVAPFVEQKMGLSYLSWAHAWRLLMERYPGSVYQFPDPVSHNDGTMTVFCKVIIPVPNNDAQDGCDVVEREMWLPVMDGRNNAISDPDARDISDTKMRCLVKCLAMFGLGHALYAGEDLISKDEPKAEKRPVLKARAAAAKPVEENPVLEDVIPKPPKPEPKKEEKDQIKSVEGATDIVGKLLQFAEEFCASEDALIDFWRRNKKIVDIIDSNFPEQYSELKAGFTALRKKINGEE